MIDTSSHCGTPWSRSGYTQPASNFTLGVINRAETETVDDSADKVTLYAYIRGYEA